MTLITRMIPDGYDEIVREYVKTREAIKITAQRVAVFHGWNDAQELAALRAYSRRLALARTRHPDKPVQLSLF